MWWDERLRLTAFLAVPVIFPAQAPAQPDERSEGFSAFGAADGASPPCNGSVSSTEKAWSSHARPKPGEAPQQNGQTATLRATIDLDCPYVRYVLEGQKPRRLRLAKPSETTSSPCCAACGVLDSGFHVH